MAETNYTVTLSEKQVKDIQAAVAINYATDVQDFLNTAVTSYIASTKTWDQLLDESLEQTGGPPTKKEREWLDSIFRPDAGSKAKKKKKVA